MRRILFGLLTLGFGLATVPAGTFTCTWNFGDLTLDPLAIKRVTVEPLANYGANSNVLIITGDEIVRQTGGTGSLSVTNMVNGRSYRVRLEGRPTVWGTNYVTCFTNTFDTNVVGTVNGADPLYLTAPVRDTTTIAFSQAAADARFLGRTNGSGHAVTSTGTNTFSAISLGGEARTNWPSGGGTTNIFHVANYGAVGDGATVDDAAFSNCLAAATLAGGVMQWGGRGESYVLSNFVFTTAPRWLNGTGGRLVHVGTNWLMRYTNVFGNFYGVHVSAEGAAATTSPGCVLALGTPANRRLDDVTIEGYANGYGLCAEGLSWFTMNNCYFTTNKIHMGFGSFCDEMDLEARFTAGDIGVECNVSNAAFTLPGGALSHNGFWRLAANYTKDVLVYVASNVKIQMAAEQIPNTFISFGHHPDRHNWAHGRDEADFASRECDLKLTWKGHLNDGSTNHPIEINHQVLGLLLRGRHESLTTALVKSRVAAGDATRIYADQLDAGETLMEFSDGRAIPAVYPSGNSIIEIRNTPFRVFSQGGGTPGNYPHFAGIGLGTVPNANSPETQIGWWSDKQHTNFVGGLRFNGENVIEETNAPMTFWSSVTLKTNLAGVLRLGNTTNPPAASGTKLWLGDDSNGGQVAAGVYNGVATLDLLVYQDDAYVGTHNSGSLFLSQNNAGRVEIGADGMYPTASNSYALGSGGSPWQKVVATDFYGSGSGLTNLNVNGTNVTGLLTMAHVQQNTYALRHWFAQLGGNKAGAAYISNLTQLGISDSIWQNNMGPAVHQRGTNDWGFGGVGWCGAATNAVIREPYGISRTYSGTWSNATGPYSPCKLWIESSEPSASITFTTICTTVNLGYVKFDSGGGTFTVAVDGGAATTISCDGTGTSVGVLTNITAGATAVSRRIVVTVVSGRVGIAGGIFDAFVAGTGSYRYDGFAFGGAMVTNFSQMDSNTFRNYMIASDPDVTTLSFFTNDRGNRTPDEYEQDFIDLITAIWAACPRTSIEICTHPENGDPTKTNTHPVALYNAKVLGLVDRYELALMPFHLALRSYAEAPEDWSNYSHWGSKQGATAAELIRWEHGSFNTVVNVLSATRLAAVYATSGNLTVNNAFVSSGSTTLGIVDPYGGTPNLKLATGKGLVFNAGVNDSAPAIGYSGYALLVGGGLSVGKTNHPATGQLSLVHTNAVLLSTDSNGSVVPVDYLAPVASVNTNWCHSATYEATNLPAFTLLASAPGGFYRLTGYLTTTNRLTDPYISTQMKVLLAWADEFKARTIVDADGSAGTSIPLVTLDTNSVMSWSFVFEQAAGSNITVTTAWETEEADDVSGNLKLRLFYLGP